jgi:hypothetical protein
MRLPLHGLVLESGKSKKGAVIYMTPEEKARAAGELSVIKALLGSASNVPVLQPAYPTVGPMLVIPGLPMVSQAIKVQNDAVVKLTALVEKLVNS